jgi:DedD protein
METSIKHRIVGVVVLLVLALLLLPLLMHRANAPDKAQNPVQVTIELPPSLAGDSEIVIDNTSAQTSVAEVQATEPVQATEVAQVEEQVQDNMSAAQSAKPVQASNDVSQVPTVADQDSVEIVTSQPIAAVDAQKSSSGPVATASVKTDKQVAKTSVATTDKAWAIQLASFQQESNAKRLISKLRAQGYHAYFREQQYNGGVQIVRVYVGPMIDRAQAGQVLQQLSKQFQLQGFILQYKV